MNSDKKRSRPIHPEQLQLEKIPNKEFLSLKIISQLLKKANWNSVFGAVAFISVISISIGYISLIIDTRTLETNIAAAQAKITDIQATQADIQEILAHADKLTDLGEFYITVYTPFSDGGIWGYRTATGARSEHLTTCAVDPDVIPLGSKIIVGGLELTAVDTGSAVKGRVIDIFYDGPYQEAYTWLDSFETRHEVALREE